MGLFVAAERRSMYSPRTLDVLFCPSLHTTNEAYGLAELFASDPIAKRLVLQLPLHTYVPVEALSLRWGSDPRLVRGWLRVNTDAVRRLGVHTKMFTAKKVKTKAIALGGPGSDPPESRRVGGVAAPAPLHAVSCVGPTAAGTKRVEAWSQKPAPPAESTSRKSARGAADQRAAWSSTRSPLDADPRRAQRRNDAAVAEGGGAEAHAGAGAALERSGPSSVAEPWRKHDAQGWHARYVQQHDLAREAVERFIDTQREYAAAVAARDEALQRETYAAERATRMGDALDVLNSECARLLALNAALTESADAAAVAADASLRSQVRSQTDSFFTTAAARNAALVSSNARLEAHVSRLESEKAALAAKYERVARLMPRGEWAPPSERAEEFGPQFWETAPGKKAGTTVSRPAWRAQTLLAAHKRYRNALFGVSGAKWELARLATSSSKAIELLFEFPRFRKVLKRILELAHKKEALSLDQLAAQWLAKARVGIGVGRLERLVHQMLEEYSVEKKKYVARSMDVNGVAVARFHLKMPRHYLDKGVPLVLSPPPRSLFRCFWGAREAHANGPRCVFR